MSTLFALDGSAIRTVGVAIPVVYPLIEPDPLAAHALEKGGVFFVFDHSFVPVRIAGTALVYILVKTIQAFTSYTTGPNCLYPLDSPPGTSLFWAVWTWFP